MKTKGKLLALRRQLVSGALADTRPQLAIALSWVLNFFLGMILSTIPLFGGTAPFGIAIVSRGVGGLSLLFCALGASLGYLMGFGFREGIKSVAAVVLVFAASYVFQEVKLSRKRFFMPSVAAFFTLLTAFLGYYTASVGTYMILPLMAQTILAFGAAYFFREAMSFDDAMTEAAELRHGISLLILLACLLMALSRATVLDTISLGRVCSILLVQMAAFRGGALCGAGAGVVLGAAMDAVAAQNVFCALAYPLSGMLAGVFSRHGRLFFLISYILCGALAVILFATSTLHIEILYENFIASFIFLLLPNSVLNQIGAILSDGRAGAGESGLRRYTARRIRHMAQAFEDLYTTVDASIGGDHNDADISQVFDRAAEQVCCKCKHKNECWNGAYLDTLTAFNDVSAQIKDRGCLRKEDLPPHFLERCARPDELVSAVNGELRGQLYRREYAARMQENRTAAYAQYLDISAILSGVSEELVNAYGPDPLAQRRLVRYLGTMDVDADVAVFRDRSGRLHILIESVKLQKLMEEPGYLDRISEAVGVRLCRPNGGDVLF